MDKRLIQASLVLTVIGILVSIYMTVYKITNLTVMCGGSGDCEVVNASKYSEVFGGFPVAGVGVIGYLTILGLHLLEMRGKLSRENATLGLFGITLIGFLFTAYLVYIEIAVIKALCPFCVTSQVVMTLIFIVSVIRLIKSPQSQED
ncbi:MAG: vitamin K epoxide reductase family protein [Chloroflexi bacterium]|nr:vitamin K epoxide reductase family protein [Chloroflexota bacterium]